MFTIARATVVLAAVGVMASCSQEKHSRNRPPNEHRVEQSNMTNEKVIMLIEAKIEPQHRAELLEAARQYLPLVHGESGVEAFYITTRKDDPNTIVFYEVYKSQAAQDFHLQQDFTKKFLATLKSMQVGDRVRTNLVELAPGDLAPSK
ncbi:MAG TPA: putative quinol monooxygenase [Edaphobacter sp.]|nr:putative quinol monooxygenase [Edaphobacter sp.]